MRFQASLGGAPVPVRAADTDAVLIQATVRNVNYSLGSVEVEGGFGTVWASVLRTKSSGVLAGHEDMPNIGDIVLVAPMHGNAQSPVILGTIISSDKNARLFYDDNFVSKDDLVHRVYRKHESGSFSILRKLGDWVWSLKKKAAVETDSVQPNLDFSVIAGVAELTHYRGSNVKSFDFKLDQSGNLTFRLYKDDGSTAAMEITSDRTGNVVVNSATGATINGGQALAFKSALEALKSQLDDFTTKFNAHTHVVAGTLPVGPVAAVAAPPVVPVTEPPISPTGTVKTVAG